MAKIEMDVAGVLARVRTAAMAGVIEGAEMVRAEALASMREPKTGRQYPGNPRRSSAAGEAPARQTGRLAGGVDVRGDVPNLRATVNASTDYAATLEFGTAKMAPRPFMRPALAKKKAAIEKAINGRVAEALK